MHIELYGILLLNIFFAGVCSHLVLIQNILKTREDTLLTVIYAILAGVSIVGLYVVGSVAESLSLERLFIASSSLSIFLSWSLTSITQR